uniref:Plectin/eS10 N-terminal domain-containing protein n=1 Tax=Sphaeramia orbicularis TaxID=375764 RepID=A0A672ZP41_9TELE
SVMPSRQQHSLFIPSHDGVMVAKKDKRPQIKHPEVEAVTNLQVIRAMGSLKSRGYVKETFPLHTVLHGSNLWTVPRLIVPNRDAGSMPESQDAPGRTQGYRRRMMGPGDKESYSDRTPRFRGRPPAAEPARPKAHGYEGAA